MSWIKRAVVAVLAFGFVVAGLTANTSPASAAPLQQLNLYGNNLSAIGNHSHCRGAIHIGFSAPKGKRGHVRATFTSHGFTGDGSTWNRNPHCRVGLSINVWSGAPRFYNTSVTFGAKRGERIVHDIRTESGLAMVSIAPRAPGSNVSLPTAVQIYTVVP